MRPLALAVGAFLVAPAPAEAQDKADVPETVKSVVSCRAERNDAARLRCFDEAAGTLAQATESGSLVVLDREAVKRTRRSLFGFDVNLPFFRGKDEEEAPKEIVANIRSIRAAGYENWLMTLDNGASWQTTEPTPTVPMPRAGDQVRILRGPVGGYMVQVGSRRIRARRLR